MTKTGPNTNSPTNFGAGLLTADARAAPYNSSSIAEKTRPFSQALSCQVRLHETPFKYDAGEKKRICAAYEAVLPWLLKWAQELLESEGWEKAEGGSDETFRLKIRHKALDHHMNIPRTVDYFFNGDSVVRFNVFLRGYPVTYCVNKQEERLGFPSRGVQISLPGLPIPLQNIVHLLQWTLRWQLGIRGVSLPQRSLVSPSEPSRSLLSSTSPPPSLTSGPSHTPAPPSSSFPHSNSTPASKAVEAFTCFLPPWKWTEDNLDVVLAVLQARSGWDETEALYWIPYMENAAWFWRSPGKYSMATVEPVPHIPYPEVVKPRSHTPPRSPNYNHHKRERDEDDSEAEVEAQLTKRARRASTPLPEPYMAEDLEGGKQTTAWTWDQCCQTGWEIHVVRTCSVSEDQLIAAEYGPPKGTRTNGGKKDSAQGQPRARNHIPRTAVRSGFLRSAGTSRPSY